MHEHYVRPCECGGREDTRWLEVTDAAGRGLRVTGSGLFHFSALPWTLEQYDAADYQDQLGESQGVELTLDGWHAGSGRRHRLDQEHPPRVPHPPGELLLRNHPFLAGPVTTRKGERRPPRSKRAAAFFHGMLETPAARETKTPRHTGVWWGLLVPPTGLEPVRYFYRGILSPLCLPISPWRQIDRP